MAPTLPIVEEDAEDMPSFPSDVAFDETLNTIGRKFLRQVQVQKSVNHRRARGLSRGLGLDTVFLKDEGDAASYYRVLILDACTRTRDHLADDLETHVEITAVSSIQEATAVMKITMFDLILARLDQVNSTTSELENARLLSSFIQHLHQQEEHEHCPMVILLFSTRQELESRLIQDELMQCLDFGAAGYFVEQDMSQKVLLEKLRRYLEQFYKTEKILRETNPEKYIHIQKRQDYVHSTSAVNTAGQSSPYTSNRNFMSKSLNSQRKNPKEIDLRGLLENRKRRSMALLAGTRNNSMMSFGDKMALFASNFDQSSREDVQRDLIFSHPAKYQLQVNASQYRKLLSHDDTGTFHSTDVLLPPMVPMDPRKSISDRQSLVLRGYAHFCSGQHVKSMEIYDHILASDKHVCQVEFLRGLCLGAQGKYAESELAFSHCIDIRSRSGPRSRVYHEAHFNRGICRLNQAHEELALADFDVAVAIKPKVEIYHQARALLLRREGKYHAADRDYRTCTIHHHGSGSSSSSGGGGANTNKANGRFKRVASSLALRQIDRQNRQSLIHESLPRLLMEYDMPLGVYGHLFSGMSDLHEALAVSPGSRRTSLQLSVITECCAQIPFFCEFPTSVLYDMAREFEVCDLEIGEEFRLPLTYPTAMYMMLEGSIQSRHVMLKSNDPNHHSKKSQMTHSVFRIIPKDVFGSLGYSIPKYIDALVIEKQTKVVWVSEAIYQTVVHPAWIAIQRERFQHLRTFAMFRNFSDHDLSHLVNRSTRLRFQKDQVMLAQGTTVTQVYFLIKGLASMSISKSNPCLHDDPRRSSKRNRRVSLSGARLSPTITSLMTQKTDKEAKKDKEAKSKTFLKFENPIWSLPLEEHQKSGQLPKTQLFLKSFTCPAVIGDVAIRTSPHNRMRATLTAETTVDVLAIEWPDLLHFDKCGDIAEEIRRVGPTYPPSTDVLETYVEKQIEWKEYCADELLRISKARWPVEKERLIGLSGGKNVIRPQK